MARKALPKKRIDNTRVSVTFTPNQYTELRRIARHKRVSVAWVVRDAVEQYIAAQTPLFPTSAQREPPAT